MKSNNKSRGIGSNFLLSAVLLFSLAANINQVSATMNCLQCMRSDFSATFMVTFSYCLADDACL
jgi:hypothetical protein